jgi:YbgC/YbaW family acyl-CoA thioester hydrolase
MNELKLIDFIGRVVTSRERVQFTHVDPYGHLNSARYTEFLINHRIDAIEDQLQVATLDIGKVLGTAFVISRMDIRYVSPSFLGEELEIASWIERLDKSGFELRLVISGGERRRVRAQAMQEIRTVNFKTGQVIDCPSFLPTKGPADILHTRPLKAEYLAGISGYREI